MQLINGVPTDKEEGRVQIRVQILLAAVHQEDKLPASIQKTLPGYFYRCGE